MNPAHGLSAFCLALLLTGCDNPKIPANAPKLPAPFAFATAAEGAALLGTSDACTQNFSPFDRAVRMRTAEPTTEADLLAFAASHTLEWTGKEMKKVASALRSFAPEWADMTIEWPERVLLLKTTGKEDGDAFYTRQNAIIIPAGKIGNKVFRATLAHEVFHIISRANPEKTDAFYATLGYEPANTNLVPRAWRTHHLTNPDAPESRHGIQVTHDGKPTWIAPVIVSHDETFDPAKNWSLLRYISLRWVVLDKTPDGFQPRLHPAESPPASPPQPVHIHLREATGFYEQVGRNTSYIIHPEEMLADQFALIVQKKKRIPSPKQLDAFRKVLMSP